MSLLLLFRSTPRAYEDSASLSLKLPLIGRSIVRDEFDRADSTSLGANWSEDEADPDFFSIVSEKLEIGDTGAAGVAMYVGPGGDYGHNQFAEGFLEGRVDPHGGLAVRLTGTRSSLNGYSLEVSWSIVSQDMTLTLRKYTNQDLSVDPGPTLAFYNRANVSAFPAAVYRLEVEDIPGTTNAVLRVYEGGVLRIEKVDTTPRPGGRVGFALAFGGGGTLVGPYRNFEGGSLRLEVDQIAAISGPPAMLKLTTPSVIAPSVAAFSAQNEGSKVVITLAEQHLFAALAEGSLFIHFVPVSASDVYTPAEGGIDYTDFPSLLFKIIPTSPADNLLAAQDTPGITERFILSERDLLAATDSGAANLIITIQSQSTRGMLEAGDATVRLRLSETDQTTLTDDGEMVLHLAPTQVQDVLAALATGSLKVVFVPSAEDNSSRAYTDAPSLTFRVIPTSSHQYGAVDESGATIHFSTVAQNLLTALATGQLTVRFVPASESFISMFESGALTFKLVPISENFRGMIEAGITKFRLDMSEADLLAAASTGAAVVHLIPSATDVLVGQVRDYTDEPVLAMILAVRGDDVYNRPVAPPAQIVDADGRVQFVGADTRVPVVTVDGQRIVIVVPTRRTVQVAGRRTTVKKEFLQ